MKTFKKLALVSAIAAAPFAAQAMEALDDSTLGNTTGQAGVTVEMSIGDAGITIGGITYTDTATVNDSATADREADRYADGKDKTNATAAEAFYDGGSVVMQNLTIKNITKLVQTIDVSSEGHLLMGMSGDSALVRGKVGASGALVDMTASDLGSDEASDGDNVSTATDLAGITIANTSSITADEATAINNHRLSAGVGVKNIQIALGGSAATSAVLLQGTNGNQAELVNHLSLSVDLGDSVTTVYNMSNVGEGVASADYEAVTTVTGTGADITLTAGQAETLGGGAKAGDTHTLANLATLTSTLQGSVDSVGHLSNAGVIGDSATTTAAMAIGMEASFRLNNLDVGVFGYTEAQATAKVATGMAAASASTTDTAADFIDADGKILGGTAAENQVALAANGSAIEIKGMSFAGLDGGLVKVDQVIWADAKGVNMQIGQIQGNLNISAIEIGGSSIGSVAVTGINLAGMTQTIYGH
ncbi:MAG: DUF6160 family protein [Oleispira sp.]